MLVAVALVTAVPIVYLVSLSVRARDDVLSGGLLPSKLFLQNWPDAFRALDLWRFLLNSWVVALLAVALTLVIAVPGAYYVARSEVGGRRLAGAAMASYCAPPVVAILPLFFVLRALELNNTLPGLALVVGLANVPVALWLLEGFIRRIPVEIEEAARLDGLDHWGTLRRIVIPLSGPGLVAAGLICFFLSYNELLFAISFQQRTDTQTLPVAISLFQGDRRIEFGQQAVASIVAVAPVYLLAVLAQRRLVDGLSAGALK